MSPFYLCASVSLFASFASLSIAAADEASALANIKSFAFGGIGYAGTMSQGEKLFRAVLGHRKAIAEFHMILATGTAEAKLYALCGIRALDKESFEGAAASLKKENTKVETIAGCSIMKEKSAGVIRNIAKGQYDSYWSKE